MRLLALATLAALPICTNSAVASKTKTVTLTHFDFVIESYRYLPRSVAGEKLTALDGPTKFTCKAKDGCTVIETMTAQIGGSTQSGNSVGLCVLVDGVQMNAGCIKTVAQLGDQGNYIAMNWRDNVHVKTGTHTLKTQILFFSDAVVGWFQNDYSIYH